MSSCFVSGSPLLENCPEGANGAVGANTSIRSAGGSSLWPWLAVVLVVGGGFRLIWGETIEYKQDEAWLYGLAADHVLRGDWAELGMPSSQHVRVPGMSVWVFYPLAHLFGVSEPTAVARGVQLCNLTALVLLVLFAWRCVPAGEREAWLWAAALLAVNPHTVIFHRKLWPPCMLPLFCVCFTVSWWYRRRPWGALAWGMLGACLGQIHASGFLFAAAVCISTVWAEGRRIRWGWWLTGSVLGTLPMTRWLLYLVRNPDPVHSNFFAFHRWLEGKFWGYWTTESMGLDLQGIFGADHADLLRWPLLAGWPSYGVAMLQVLAGLLGATIVAVGLWRWRRRDSADVDQPLTQTALLLRAGLLGYGLLATLAAVRFYRHYMLVTFPLTAVWMAVLALPRTSHGRGLAWGRRLLFGLCLVNALCSAVALSYLHAHGGAKLGGFGPDYGSQVLRTGQRPPWIYRPKEG